VLDLIQNTIDGVMIGGAYALLALGFTLTFGVMRRLNLAFGAIVLCGLYAGAAAHQALGWGLLGSIAATLAVAVAAGLYVERLCFRALAESASIAAMVSSFAIWMQLEEIAALLMPRRTYAYPALSEARPWEWAGLSLRPDQLAMAAVALGAMAALGWTLRRTRFGLAARAVATAPLAARLAGIEPARIGSAMFLLACGLGGLAGALIAAVDSQVTIKFGMWAMLKGLVAMTLGGIGSIPGAVIGGLALGVIESNAQWYLGAEWRDIVAYGLLFAVLYWRRGRERPWTNS